MADSKLDDANEEETEQQIDFTSHVKLDLDDLDLTTEAIDLTDVDKDLEAFQKDDFVRQSLEKNVNLSKYAKKIEEDLKQVEMESIKDYIENAEELVDLHDEIKNCDDLLAKMEQMLSGFQDHLKSISGEIRHLQDKSLAMNVQLTNKKNAEKELGKYVRQLVITDEFITAIKEAPVGREYMEPLSELNGKMQFHSSLDSSYNAVQDIAPDLEGLKNNAIIRLRQFLITEFQKLAVPRTNISVHQQHLMNFKYFMTFLDQMEQKDKFHSDSMRVASELRNFYIDLMSKVYLGHFRSYVQSLSRFRDMNGIADKTDLLGTDVKNTGGLFQFSSKKSVEYLNKVFNITHRIHILDKFGESSPMFVQHLKNNEQKFNYEILFHSYIRLLSEQAGHEYRFLLQFFHRRDMFDTIFDKVLALFQEEFAQFRQTCYDSLGLLLMIRIVEMQQEELHKKKVSCLEKFFDTLYQTFWPRFKIIFDDNVASIKSLEPTKGEIKNLRESPNAPHFSTIRFATYVTGILLLNQDKQQQILDTCVVSLREAFEKLLLRLADKIENEKDRIVFLINNYYIILSTMDQSKIDKSGKEYLAFSAMLDNTVQDYIKIEWREHLGRWIGFTITTEQKLQKHAKIDMSQLESVAREFQNNWQTAVEKSIQNVQSNFIPNLDASIARELGNENLLQNSKRILSKLLTELMLYHTRFQQVVKQVSANQGRDQNIMAALVHENDLKFQIRRYWEDRA